MKHWFWLLTLIIFFLFPLTIFSQVDLNKGLMAYYPFNGNANDASGNGNNPIFNNATLTSDYYGNPNSAYYFNGIDNYMEIPNNASLNPSEFTLCALVNVKGFYYGNCYNNCIIDKGDADGSIGDYSLRFTQSAITNGNCSIQDILNQQFVGYAYNNPVAGLYEPKVQKNVWTCLVYSLSADSLKLYVGGNLVWKAQKTGDVGSNSYNVFLGRKGDASFPYWFNGIMDEVRIYNRALNADEVKEYSTVCTTKNNVTASFTGPDTACINIPVQFRNTSTGASNYYWGFCAAGFNTTPVADNLGNPGNLLKTPVFMDYALDDNGNYYGFISNYENGHIVELNYGNSLLNTPTATDLGNFSGIIPIYAEGIQVKKANGKCYVFVVAAGDAAGSGSVLIRLDFGASFSNTPTAASLGNVGNLLFPHDLFITAENNSFYGFTININNNTITRFDFGNNLENQPVGVNFGSIGDLNYPCGFSFVNTNGNWYAFITNRNSNSISRLNFGSSLTNIPTGSNIGNPGNFLNRPRDISIFQSCSGVVGLVVNEEDEEIGTITKLDFGGDVLLNPQTSNLGNLGSLQFPHSISKFFLEGSDIYSFITNVKNNTVTRLRYTGCTSTNIASSTQQTPPLVTYTEPGTYNVNLLVDIGLPTQTSFCKQIVVLNCDTVCNLQAGFTYQQNTCNPKTIQFKDTTSSADSIWWDFGNGQTAGNVKDTAITYASFGNYTVKLFAKTSTDCFDTALYTINVIIENDSAVITNDTSICSSDSIQLKAITGLNYCWSPAIGLSNSSIQNPVARPAVTTTYYLNILTINNKPVVRDSVTVTVVQPPVVNAGNDVSSCENSPVQLNASGALNYLWNASPYLSDTTIANPVAIPLDTTSFIVKGYNSQGCFNSDTVEVFVLSSPGITLTNDTAVCTGGSVLLEAKTAGSNIFSWSPSAGLSNTSVYDPVASPAVATKYFIKVTGENNCSATDSVVVDVLPLPAVSTINDTSVCLHTPIILSANAVNANIFKWSPSAGLSDLNVQSPTASPETSTLYVIEAGNGICSEKDSVLISLLSLPDVKTGNDTTVCGNAAVQLNAFGALSYTWMPATGLSNATIPNPVASPGITTTYIVTGVGANTCTNSDSVQIAVNPPPAFDVSPKNISLCLGDSVLLTASGGDIYNWSPANNISGTSTASVEVYPSQQTTFAVTITNSVCKVTDVLTSNIIVKDLPTVSISKSNDIDCLNFQSQLIASGGVSYKWSPSSYISNPQIFNPVVNPPADTKYFVTAFDANGCKNGDSVLVKSNTDNANLAKFEVANAFTPNHDGVNDCFSLRYWGPADFFDLSIYNRFGQIVYHSNNTISCWDGTFNGQPQATGTYVYILTASTKCSNGVLHKKGTIVLIR